LNIKYVIATRNYEFLMPALIPNKRTFALLNRNGCTCWINKYMTANYGIV